MSKPKSCPAQGWCCSPRANPSVLMAERFPSLLGVLCPSQPPLAAPHLLTLNHPQVRALWWFPVIIENLWQWLSKVSLPLASLPSTLQLQSLPYGKTHLFFQPKGLYSGLCAEMDYLIPLLTVVCILLPEDNKSGSSATSHRAKPACTASLGWDLLGKGGEGCDVSLPPWLGTSQCPEQPQNSGHKANTSRAPSLCCPGKGSD